MVTCNSIRILPDKNVRTIRQLRQLEERIVSRVTLAADDKVQPLGVHGVDLGEHLHFQPLTTYFLHQAQL